MCVQHYMIFCIVIRKNGIAVIKHVSFISILCLQMPLVLTLSEHPLKLDVTINIQNSKYSLCPPALLAKIYDGSLFPSFSVPSILSISLTSQISHNDKKTSLPYAEHFCLGFSYVQNKYPKLYWDASRSSCEYACALAR